MKKTIELGKVEYTYEVNFKLSFNFQKYRNRLVSNIDIEKVDKKAYKELTECFDKIEKLTKQGKEINEQEMYEQLSPKALKLLKELTDIKVDAFDQNEILDIVSKFTGITNEDKLIEILDAEIEENGFDVLMAKLLSSVKEVFTSAKGSSQLKEVNE